MFQQDSKSLYERLNKNPLEWSPTYTIAIRKIKVKAKELSCLFLPNHYALKIVETDISNMGTKES